MSLPLVILSSIALMADSIEATPRGWVGKNKRAVEATKSEVAVAAAAEDDDRFQNATTTTKKISSAKPTTTKPASVKPTTTKAASAKPSSAKPSSAKPSSVKPSSVNSSAPVASSTSSPVIPPLIVPVNTPTTSLSATNSPVPSSASSTDGGGGISGGAIGGIVAAIIIIIGGFAAYFVIRRKKINKERMQNRSTKPDPFTMGYGSDQAFNSQPMQQQQQQQYQHQYGVQNTSPTSPTSPTYYNNNNMQFAEANNHIVAEPIIAAAAMSQYQPQMQPQYTDEQQYQPQANQQYQPQIVQPQIVQPQANQNYTTPMYNNETMDTNVAPIVVTTPTNNGLLAPTQAGSVGVFHVAATYTPTLSDEIDIQTGDQVEVLVEYDDGWCQGINLSRGNTKGVFPKHCIDYASGTSATSNVDRVKRVSSMYIA